MLLALDAIAHFLVDAVCACTLFGALDLGRFSLSTGILLYNCLAFSSQCLVGLFTDRLGRTKAFTAGAALAVALGCCLRPAPGLVRVLLIGLGNSFFHVGGGTRTLRQSGGEAQKLGVFVAPGSLGLFLGMQFPKLGLVFSCLLAVYAAGILLLPDAAGTPPQTTAPERDAPLSVVLLLTAAVAVRAVGGSCVSFPWKTGALLSLLMTLCVFLGKTLGGFVCDGLGARRTALLSLPLAALLVSFGSAWMLPSLLGQLCVNLTMPVTLYLLYRALPDTPGFAFGLAASALWPGTLAGELIRLTGVWRTALILLCFAFGLFAILYAERRIFYEKPKPSAKSAVRPVLRRRP